MDVQQAYDEWARSYDDDVNRTRDLDADILRSQLIDQHFDHAIELGCGTGKNTVFLATIAARVTAFDFSTEMLTRARQKVDSPHVDFQRLDITHTWPTRSDGADLIICNLVLEHVERLQSVFTQASRSLTVGGLFLVNELHPFRQYLGSVARFERAGETIRIPAFTHHVSDYVSAAKDANLSLVDALESWNSVERDTPPRLLTLLFRKWANNPEK